MKAKRIMIVGAGGLGVPAAIAIARARSIEISLVDPDPVELSNLARQVAYREFDIGRPKVEAAADNLRRKFDGLKIGVHRCELNSGNAVRLISLNDFVIDATDDPAAKFLINDTCIRIGRPFVYGGVLGLNGQAMTVIPARTACIRCLFEEPPDPGEVASCREAGIVGPVAGAIGEIQAAEAIAWAAGSGPRLAGKILTYEGAAGRIRVTEIKPRRGCRCGARSERTSPVAPA